MSCPLPQPCQKEREEKGAPPGKERNFLGQKKERIIEAARKRGTRSLEEGDGSPFGNQGRGMGRRGGCIGGRRKHCIPRNHTRCRTVRAL